MSITRYPAFTNPNGATVASTVTCQVYRLEKHDTDRNEFKHYTGILAVAGSRALFGYSRIGAKYQWLDKGQSASAASIVQKKLNEKRSGGYEDVWSGDITVPADYLEEVNRSALQYAIERARLEGARSFATGVDSDERQTPLAALVVRSREVLSKMADNPDRAMTDYVALVADHEAITADLTVVESYIDTLRLMIAGAGRG